MMSLTPQLVTFAFLVLIFLGLLLIVSIGKRTTQRKKLLDDFHNIESEVAERSTRAEKVAAFFSKAFTSDEVDIKNKFVAAGFYDFKYAALYMPMKYSLLFVGGAVLYLVTAQDTEPTKLIAILAAWAVAVIIVPDAILDSKAKALVRRVSTQLPYLIDLMAVCVQTGMTIETTMTYLSKEMAGFDIDLAHVLKKTSDRARIVGLATALDELYLRVPSTEMRSFVMTLKQSLQYGSSIYSVLTTLSADIREIQMLGIEEKIGKLAAKMSIPLILFIMIPIVILIAAPGIMRMMVDV